MLALEPHPLGGETENMRLFVQFSLIQSAVFNPKPSRKDMQPTDDLALAAVPAIHGGRPLFAERFRFCQPLLPTLVSAMQYYVAAYTDGTITNASAVEHLEAAVAERLQVKHCVAVSSCTSGLMLVLRALGVTGEVIVPSFTFFATGHAVLWNGLRPVFADCDEETWNVDPVDVEEQITEDTSAILVVHLYGNPCRVEELERLASRRQLKLLFDAAHGFGSHYRNRPLGGFGDAEVFSLSPTKLLVAGEGGLVTTNDATLARAIRAMRNYGDLGAYDPEWLGMSARMPEFNAALALAGLPLVEAKVARRNRIAEKYTDLLASLPGLRFQKVLPSNVSTYKDYSIHVSSDAFGMTRDALAEALLAEKIETKKYFFPPLHKQRLYSSFHSTERGGLARTSYVAGGIVSLPIYESLPDATVEQVAYAIQRLARFNSSERRALANQRCGHVAARA
jgi:dTDP-4-amino-4,6-dideoxygalactose transaminase